MMDYRQAVCLTTESAWRRLSDLEKRDVLQVLEIKIASREGRRARNIVFEEMPPSYFGYYDHKDPANIHMSYNGLDDVNEALDTLYHEGRHAYQHDCVDNGTGFPEPIRKQFEQSFANPIDPEQNFSAYCDKYTERDACNFAKQQCELLSIERETYLSQGQTDEKVHEAAPDRSEISASAKSGGSEQINNASAHYAPALMQWANETCSWQPEIEAVKVYGGSSTANKIYTNRDVYEMVQKRFAEDRNLAAGNWGHLPPEQKSELEKHWNQECSIESALQNNLGYGKEFDKCVASFFFASDNVRNCCPYEVQQHTPDYSVKKPAESIDAQRQSAVNKAWAREVDLVRDGQGTRNWSVSQQAEMQEYGKVTGFEGSHMMNAKDYPEYAGNPDNIQFLPSTAHFEGVHAGYPRGINPNGRFDENTGEVVPVEDGRIPEQPIIELSDRYDHSQKEYHKATPKMEQSGQRRHDDYYQSKKNHPEKSQKIGFRADPKESDSESQLQHSTTDDTQNETAEQAQDQSNFWSNIPRREDQPNDQSREQCHSEKNSLSM